MGRRATREGDEVDGERRRRIGVDGINAGRRRCGRGSADCGRAAEEAAAAAAATARQDREDDVDISVAACDIVDFEEKKEEGKENEEASSLSYR